TPWRLTRKTATGSKATGAASARPASHANRPSPRKDGRIAAPAVGRKRLFPGEDGLPLFHEGRYRLHHVFRRDHGRILLGRIRAPGVDPVVPAVEDGVLGALDREGRKGGDLFADLFRLAVQLLPVHAEPGDEAHLQGLRDV